MSDRCSESLSIEGRVFQCLSPGPHDGKSHYSWEAKAVWPHSVPTEEEFVLLTPIRPQSLIEAMQDRLVGIHFDGTGCKSHGSSACVHCFGPSPMSASEIADDLYKYVLKPFLAAASRPSPERATLDD